MPWKVTGVMEERMQFLALMLAGNHNLSEACRLFGISRKTGYKWLARYKENQSFTQLVDRSRRPKSSPRKTPRKIEDQVLELRDRHGWGARKLKVLLAKQKVCLSERTINRILKRRGAISAEPSHRPAMTRFEYEKPNQLWQMDFKGQFQSPPPNCYPLSIVDDHSRFLVGLWALPNQQYREVHRCLVSAFESYGIPEAMLMDHGTPWWSNSNGHGLTRLGVGMISQGIRLYWSGIAHPQTQGKVERFHRTLAASVAHRGRPREWGLWSTLFREFRAEYNEVRPHEAIQMRVPAECYKPSRRAYNPNPQPWEYPSGMRVETVQAQGCLYLYGRHYFVCGALPGERVGVEEIAGKLLIRYRHMYIREVDLKKGNTRPFLAEAGSSNQN